MATDKLKKGLDEPMLEGGGAAAGYKSSKVGADDVLAKLRSKFGVSEKDLNAKREIRDPSVLDEAARSRALSNYRRNKAAEASTKEDGVTKVPYVEPTEKKKGGVVSASKRADGIAARGKTRGRMV